jgi:diguanylate cyclase (GGDEF)-like protein/PAS domain S-box-containing protein
LPALALLASPVLAQPPAEPGVSADTLIGYGIFLVFLLLLVGYWAYRLRSEIAQREAVEVREQSRTSILEMLARAAPLPEVLEAIIARVERGNPRMLCSIHMRAAQSADSRASQTLAPGLPDDCKEALGGPPVGAAAADDERLIVADMATHADWLPFRELAARTGLHACWSQAIRSSGEQILGRLTIYHREARTPSAEDLLLLEQSASLASIAIEKNITLEKLRESEAHYRLLTEDAADVLWRTDRDLRITYINPVDEKLRGYRADEVIGHHVFEMFTAEGIATVTQLMRQRQAAERDGVHGGPALFEVQHRCKDGSLKWAEVRSTPLRDARGTIIGYHGITRETTERKAMQDQVHQLAFYDPLTSLPNRRLFNDRLSQGMAASRRSGRHGALLFLDLDNFKSLNDTHGHGVGDALLVAVAARLKKCMREMDTVARFGGDEFVVLINDLDVEEAGSAAQAAAIAEKIRVTLAVPYELSCEDRENGHASIAHCCTASIGATLFAAHQASQDDILKWADTAMYEAKAAGRNAIRFFGGKA